MQFRIYDSMPNGETAKVLLNVSQERNYYVLNNFYIESV